MSGKKKVDATAARLRGLAEDILDASLSLQDGTPYDSEINGWAEEITTLAHKIIDAVEES